jgi:hypothetical protein
MDRTPIVKHETPTEYFRELVSSAVAHQQIATDEMTSFYLVNLLCRYVEATETDGIGDEPLALRLVDALRTGGAEQRLRLRRLADAALFVSGYFSDSLRRKLVDVDYYVALGGFAYGTLARSEDDVFSEVFTELAARFVGYVDVLSEVSERSGLTSNTDLLRLYEKWLRTGSLRNGRLLAERGLVPNASIGSRFLQ